MHLPGMAMVEIFGCRSVICLSMRSTITLPPINMSGGPFERKFVFQDLPNVRLAITSGNMTRLTKGSLQRLRRHRFEGLGLRPSALCGSAQAVWILMGATYLSHILVPFGKGGHPLNCELFLIGMAPRRTQRLAATPKVGESFSFLFFLGALRHTPLVFKKGIPSVGSGEGGAWEAYLTFLDSGAHEILLFGAGTWAAMEFSS